MIPKVIHYCWFGRNPLPELAEKCIMSWKMFFPNYEIREWNEDNFDVNIVPYTKEAYQFKKYAFVSDYARFWILYKYGGLYFDIDVEVIKPMEDVIEKGAFMGCENKMQKMDLSELVFASDISIGVNPGLGLGVNPGLGLGVNPGLGLGVNPGLALYKELLAVYETLHFRTTDGKLNLKTIVEYTTELLVEKGLRNTNDIQCVDGVWIYPKEYFCPIDYETKVCHITNNTRTIHHYCASWLPFKAKLYNFVKGVVGVKCTIFIAKLYSMVTS